MLKHKIKKIIAIALTATMMITASSMPVMVNAATIENSSAVSDNTGVYNGFNYSISNGTASITGYIGSETEIEIPSEINGYPVTMIGKSAFENSSITKVVVPDSVVFIDTRAFYSCTNLTTITLPKNLASIEEYTFYNCSSLSNITLPEGLAYIGPYSFYSAGLKEIVIPNSVTSLEYGTFQKCQNLIEITLSDNIEKIIYESFGGLKSLRKVKLPANLKIIERFAFSACSNLTDIIIPDKVTTIEHDAFLNCTNLKRVTIPKSVIEIGEYAFGYTYKVFYDSNGWFSHYEYNKVEGFTIYVPKQAYASAYASKHGFYLLQVSLGDIDLDGKVTIQDATLMQRYCAEDVTLNQTQLNLADADGNGDMSVGDATAIQKIVAAN